MKQVLVIGGGLSGLISAILLARRGIDVQLIEQGQYPMHRVCGEYVSNEVKPFLKAIDCFPSYLSPVDINEFHLTAIQGSSAIMNLQLGGFGISRYALDHYLFRRALEFGVHVTQGLSVVSTQYFGEHFEVLLSNGQKINSEIVLGCFGKRSKLDFKLNRPFTKNKSPWVAIKWHLQTDHPQHIIALHNFPMGYCGCSNIEDGKTNLCYLVRREQLKKEGSIKRLESNVLSQNKYLKRILGDSKKLFEKPLVINEVNFENKELIFKRIPMAGDSAGLITPLCGNGMAIAIRSGKILASHTLAYFKHQNRKKFEKTYIKEWNRNFKVRLGVGKTIQHLFGNGHGSRFSVGLLNTMPFIGEMIVKATHGSEMSANDALINPTFPLSEESRFWK